MNGPTVINIELNNCMVKLRRINALSRQSIKKFKWITIYDSTFSFFGFNALDDPYILPKFYAGLTYVTGTTEELEDSYDAYKSSYGFRFGMEVKKYDKISKYCFQLYHYRSSVACKIIQPVLQSDPRNNFTYDKPNDEFFSENEIHSFTYELYYYLMKCIEKYIPPDFVKSSDSNLVLFGYMRNKYFYESHEDPDAYEHRKNILYNRIYDQKSDFFGDLKTKLF